MFLFLERADVYDSRHIIQLIINYNILFSNKNYNKILFNMFKYFEFLRSILKTHIRVHEILSVNLFMVTCKLDISHLTR